MANLKNTVISDTVFRLPAGDTVARPSVQSQGQVRFNTDSNKTEFYNERVQNWLPINYKNLRQAEGTGGEESVIYIEGIPYKLHAYKNIGSEDFTVAVPGKIDVLVVAGGGSSEADVGGGGGAGGLLFRSGFFVAQGTYSITVGKGGDRFDGDPRGVLGSAYPLGENGDNSSAFELTAIGGGRGGAYRGSGDTASDGGSGGGDARDVKPGNGIVTQGFPGGELDGYSNHGSCGGGGAGAPGEPGSGSGSNSRGGDGLYFGHIFGETFGEDGWFAGGGGGGDSSTAPVPGGRGGGGDGKDRDTADAGNDGMPNTGGGAGGNAHPHDGHAGGGSGVVLIRYPI